MLRSHIRLRNIVQIGGASHIYFIQTDPSFPVDKLTLHFVWGLGKRLKYAIREKKLTSIISR